jgi:hypothetical protein
MAAERLSEVQLRVARLVEAGQFDQAVRTATGVRDLYPNHRARVRLWIAETYSLAGRYDEAIQELAAMPQAGLWVAKSQWEDEPPFRLLRGNAAFESVMQHMEDIGRGRRAPGKPLLSVFLPGGPAEAVLIVLHGVAESRLGSARLWAPATELGVTVVVPESPEVTTSDLTRGWISEEVARKEVWRVWKGFPKEQRALPVIIGGFSGGANLAMQWAVESPFKGFTMTRKPSIIGFVALCPAYDRDLGNIRAAARRAIRGSGLTGEVDWARHVAETLFHRLETGGVPVQLTVLRGAGHGYPPDFGERLKAALTFVIPEAEA